MLSSKWITCPPSVGEAATKNCHVSSGFGDKSCHYFCLSHPVWRQPTAHSVPKTRPSNGRELKALSAQRQVGHCLVTHDTRLIKYADRIIYLFKAELQKPISRKNNNRVIMIDSMKNFLALTILFASNVMATTNNQAGRQPFASTGSVPHNIEIIVGISKSRTRHRWMDSARVITGV